MKPLRRGSGDQSHGRGLALFSLLAAHHESGYAAL